MLDKFRSIKPTRLWYLTSLKAFRSAIKDRYDAVKNLDARFINQRANLAYAGFVWASSLAILYALGAFEPEKALKDLMPYDCKPTLRKDLDVCKPMEKVPKKPACPPVKSKPC